MTITGTKYQSSDWKIIKKILIRAGMATYGELDSPNELLQQLLSGNYIEYTQKWPNDLLEQLGKAYNTNFQNSTAYHSTEEYNERVSLAIEITDILGIQSQRIEKLLSKVQQVAQKNPSIEDWQSHRYKLLSDFFSELRYIKDAENMTVSTGRSVTAQHVQILAKIAELNRKVEKVFADGDLQTLAELTGESFQQLASNPFLLNRYTSHDNRPSLIIAADKVFREKEKKQPQLPTKKYNNLVNPDIIAKRLTELEAMKMTSTSVFNKNENSEYDKLDTLVQNNEHEWLDDLLRMIHVAQDELSDHTVNTDNFWDSPDIDNLEQIRAIESEANNSCLSAIKPMIKLGLILKLDKNNEMINLLSADDLAVLQGDKLSKAALARRSGETVHKFEKSVKQAEQDYEICMQQKIPSLQRREQ